MLNVLNVLSLSLSRSLSLSLSLSLHKPTNSSKFYLQKPTNSTKPLSLARYIVRIFTENKQNIDLKGLKVTYEKENTRKNYLSTPWQIYFNLRSTRIMAKLVLALLEVAILMINFPSIDLEIAWKTLQIDNFRKHWMKKMSSLIHEYKNKKIYTSTSEIWN